MVLPQLSRRRAACLRIGIAGGGITGLAIALLLARRGHQVLLLEKRSSTESEGAGLLLQSAGLEVLDAAGLTHLIATHGARINRLTRKNHAGVVAFDLQYGELFRSLHGVGVLRGVLHKILFDAAREAGVELKLGIEVVELFEEPTQATMIDSQGTRYDELDLVVVCDGARSRLRSCGALPAHAADYPWGVFTIVAPCPSDLRTDVLLQRFRRGPDVVGLLPSGRNLEGSECVTLFWNARVADYDAIVATGITTWQARLVDVCPEARSVFALVGSTDATKLPFWTYTTVTMNHWHTGRIVFLGDAAHALNPQLGMGANMGLADAHALASCLDNATPTDMKSSLERYQTLRERQVRFYENASRLLGPSFQLDKGFGQWTRDKLLDATVRLPLARRQLLKAICGYSKK